MMKKILAAVVLGLVIVGMIATPAFAKKKPPIPPPTPVEHGIIDGLCMFYYGAWSETAYDLITKARPEILVAETPGGTYGTQCNVNRLQSVGIGVFSYVAVGYLKEYIWDPQNPDPNTYNDIMGENGFLEEVAAEGCKGVFLDESPYDRASAPELNWSGGSNSWWNVIDDGAGGLDPANIGDVIAKAHSLGLKVMLGLGSPEIDLDHSYRSLFDPDGSNDSADYILSEEWYDGRVPQQGEVGHADQCIVIGHRANSAGKAAALTEAAWGNGFYGAYQCKSYGELAPWFVDYINLLVEYRQSQ
jgi:hypothetical protein